MKVIDKDQQQKIQNKSNNAKNIQITIKNINRSIQDMQLQIPISWTFGQMIFIVSQNHHQLINYKTHGMKFMIAGNYVDEEEQVSKYLKFGQSELVVYLKIDMNPSENLAKIQQAKLNLNQQYVNNHLWENYIENLLPFATGEQEVRERNIQQQQIDLEILSSAFPILHDQTESCLSETKAVEIDAQQNQLDLELNEDNFFATNILVIFLIYYFVISKFEGKIYYVLIVILFIYYFIKYQDNKHTIQQRQQNERNRQINNQPEQQQNNNQSNNQNNNNNLENNNQNQNDQKDLSEPNTNSIEQKEDTQNPNQNQQNINNQEQNISLVNQTNKEQPGNPNKNENSDNMQLNENNQDSSSKEINIVDSDKNKEQQQNNTNDNSQATSQQSKEMIKRKKQTNSFIMILLRIKEIVQCFIMSLFPVWHIDLYIKNNPHPDTIIEEEEQKNDETKNQKSENQHDSNNGNEQDQNEGNINNQEAEQQNNQQGQQNQQQKLGLLDRFQNYLDNKLKQYEREEQILRQQIEQLKNEAAQQNNLINQAQDNLQQEEDNNDD